MPVDPFFLIGLPYMHTMNARRVWLETLVEATSLQKVLAHRPELNRDGFRQDSDTMMHL